MKKSHIISFFIGFILFIGLNSFISTKLFLDAFLAYNPINYFYIEHHWKINHIRANNLNNGDAVILGSSRSIYGLNPLIIDKHQGELSNLSLMGANQEDILNLLKKIPEDIRYIILEFNPASLSKRQLIRQNFFDKKNISLSPASKIIPLVWYREILSSTLKKMTRENILIQDQMRYENKRNKLRRYEFHQLDQNSMRGHIGISSKRVSQLGITEGLTKECQTIYHWSLGSDSFQRGKQLFKKTLKMAKNKTNHVLIVIYPTSKRENVLPRINSLYVWATELAKSKDVSILDLRNMKKSFFDCIHLNKEGAEKVSARVQRHLEMTIQEL